MVRINIKCVCGNAELVGQGGLLFVRWEAGGAWRICQRVGGGDHVFNELEGLKDLEESLRLQDEFRPSQPNKSHFIFTT